MSQKYEKLKTLLQELFQLDQPDLDFGLYRVMHAKSTEVSQFLDQDLLPQVQAAFGQYKTADKAEIEKELAKVIAGIEAAGMDPAQSPKVADLRARLANDAVDIGALESEVYDHLFSFFRRYYSEGDFLAKRRRFSLWRDGEEEELPHFFPSTPLPSNQGGTERPVAAAHRRLRQRPHDNQSHVHAAVLPGLSDSSRAA